MTSFFSDMEEKRHTLPRAKMIKRRSDFQHVYQKGTSARGRRMILYVLRDSRVAGKVGFAAGKNSGAPLCAAVRSVSCVRRIAICSMSCAPMSGFS